jgi:predicted dehydrogenase
MVSNAEALLKEYANGKAIAYQDWRAMLDKEKLDIVVVATPNKFLREISLWAAEKGFHILCEKPLGRNTREAQEIVEAVKKKNVILKTGFNHRHHPAISKAHELIQKGDIGEIYYAQCIYGHGGRPGYEREWRASREICGGGELLDQGVHAADHFRWFLGDFEEAFGTISTYYWDMEVEDNAFALFRTTKGQTASMHTSWTQWKNRFTFEIYGEAGYVMVEGLGGSYGTETLRIGKRKLVDSYKLFVDKNGKEVNSYELLVNREKIFQDLPDEQIPNQLITSQPITNNVVPQYAGGAPEEEVIEFPGPDHSWQEEWKEFTTAIIEKRQPLGNGLDGLEANRMIEAVYTSARENRPIKIKGIR